MTLTDYKNNRMKNAEFAEAYDEVQSEMNEIRAVIDNCIINNKISKRIGGDVEAEKYRKLPPLI